MTLPVRTTTRTVRIYLSSAQLEKIIEVFAALPYGNVALMSTDHMLGVIPVERLGSAAFLKRCTAQIQPVKIEDEPEGEPLPGVWSIWFAGSLGDEIAPGLHYLEFHLGPNGMVAVIQSDAEVRAVSPTVM